MDFHDQLWKMLEAVTLNAGYHRYIDSIDILSEAEFYLEICQLIFPEINISLVKILEDNTMNCGKKLQELIDQLSKLLKFDLKDLSGEEIVKGNPKQIFWLLDLLVELSERCI